MSADRLRLVNMNKFERKLIATVLQETLNKISIVNRGRHVHCTNLTKSSIQNRFKEKVHESVYQELDPFKVTTDVLNDIKLQKDINFLEIVLCKTLHEILISSSWKYLENITSEEEKLHQEEKELMCRHRCNAVALDSYKKRIGKKITKFDMRLRVADEIFADVKDEMKNIKQINEIELSLVRKWEKSRFEQVKLLHEQDEKRLLNEQKLFDYKRSNEQRFIYDIETYNGIQIKEYESQIEYWQHKYNIELKELNDKIKDLTQSIFKVTKKHERHRDISIKRQQFIDEYVEQKERERQEYEIEQNRIQSAIKIQAWWRGVMVRKHLGPYRRKKKGKKGGKKGNK